MLMYVAEVIFFFEIIPPSVTRWDGFVSYCLLTKEELGVYFFREEKENAARNKISWELVSQLLQVNN